MQTVVESNNFSRFPHVWKKLNRTPEFSPNDLMHPVAEWVDDRPAMQLVNSAIPFMGLRIMEETEEIREGLAIGGLELAKELNDQFFFEASLAHNLGKLEEIHLPSLASRLNGVGARDDILDKMREVAGNMEDKRTVMKDLEWLMSAWMSFLRHGPVEADPVDIMRKVIKKNGTNVSGNHPAMYYSGRDPLTGEILNPDEMYEQYRGTRGKLRAIRMHTGNRPEGLKPSDHLPFRNLINDFRRPEESFEELMEYLTLTPRISQHLSDYYQNASVKLVTSYHQYSRDHALSARELETLMPQPGLREDSSTVKFKSTSFNNSSFYLNATVRFSH